MLFCTNCGAPTGGEGKKFCTTCGAALLDDPPARPETAPKPPPPVYEAPPGSWPPTAPGIAPPALGNLPGTGPSAAGPAYAQTAPAWPAASTGGPPPGAPPRPGAPPYPPVRLRPAPPPGDRTTIWIAMVVALVLLAGGGFAVWKFLLHHGGQHPGPAAGASNQPSQGGSATGSQAASTPTPPGTPPATGGFAVAVSPAVAGQAGEPQVVSFLQRYFTAINHHNYGQYTRLVVSSERPTPQQFQSGFGTSRDSHATLTRLSPTATGVAANVSFISHQQPSASPTGTRCTSWHITLFLESRAGGYRIGPAAPGYHARDQAC